MINKFKDIGIKNHTYYFFDDIININPNTVKIDEKSHKNIIIYYIGYMTIKGSKYVKINSVNPLYVIFSKMNRCFEEINKNNCLTLARLINKNSNYCDEKYMKNKFDLDDDLPLTKAIEIHNVTIAVSAVFHENKSERFLR